MAQETFGQKVRKEADRELKQAPDILSGRASVEMARKGMQRIKERYQSFRKGKSRQ